MYYYNRMELKQEAKRLKTLASPAAWKVTLVYILLLILLDGLSVATSLSGMMSTFRFSDVTDWSYNWNSSGGFLWVQLLGIAITLVVSVLGFGYGNSYCLMVARQEASSYQNLFDGFLKLGKVVLLYILMGLFVLLWSLLLFIPGIIASYRYAMAPFILRDNPDISPLEAISRSKQMMRGHKLDYFVLQLSFIGWALLAPFTLGILYFWLQSYICVSYALFYDGLRGAADTLEA